jgi:hypothetical protein
MFLQVVSFARDVGVDFNMVGQSDARDLSQRRIRLFWSGGENTHAHPAPLRTLLQGARFAAVLQLDTAFANKLTYSWHFVSSKK